MKQSTFADIPSQPDKSGPRDDPETQAEFIERAEEYAAEVASEHFPQLAVETVEWEVSTRAERAAGRAKHNRATGDITVRLAWAAYDSAWRLYHTILDK
jgi:SprT-like protein